MNAEEQSTQVGWFGLATIWFGGIISVPALLIGSLLVSGLPFWQAIGLGALGFSLVALVMALLAPHAVARRANTVTLAAQAFGSNGAALVIGVVVGLPLMGWFGVQTAIAGASLVRILELEFALKWPLPATSFLLGLAMMLTAVLGFRWLKWLNFIAVPCKVFLVVYGVFVALRGGGWALLAEHQPDPAQAMDALTAIGLAIGFIAVGGVISPDYSRHARTVRDGVIGCVLGLIPAATLLAAAGALLAVAQRTHDIVDIYARLGMPLLALTVLIIATWTINVINVYSAGLALNGLVHGTPRTRPWATLAAGVIGSALAAAGILGQLTGFLSLLTLTVTPIAGAMVAALWLKRGAASDVSWHAPGLVAWAAGAGGMLLIDHPMRHLLGPVVAAAVFALWSRRD